MINEKYIVLSFQEAGWTEDEFNNLLIDCWSAINKKLSNDPPMYEYLDAKTNKIILSQKPITVSITFKKKIV